MKKQKAILYARIAQRQTVNRNLALQVQEEELRKYCKANNVKAMAFYQDIATGSSFERLAFIELLHFAECNKGEINLLLVTEWSRFSRSATEAMSMVRQLSDMGIKVVAVLQPAASVYDHVFDQLIFGQLKDVPHVLD